MPTEPFKVDANTIVLALNSPDVTSEDTGKVTVKRSAGTSTKDSPFTEWPEVQLQLIGGGGGSTTSSANSSANGGGGGGGFRERDAIYRTAARSTRSQSEAAAVLMPTARRHSSNARPICLGPTFRLTAAEDQARGAPTVEFGGSGGGGTGKLNSGKNGGAGGNYGYNGGKGGGSSTTGCGGAGGGAGGQPAEAAGGNPVVGGLGKMCFDGTRRAGGGGGSNGFTRANGSDGGGRGATRGGTASSGAANTGGGAGGTCPSGTSGANGAGGGSGCALIKSQIPAASISGGSEVSNPNNDGYLYRFNSSGSITF